MKILLKIKLILLVKVWYIFKKVNSDYYDPSYQDSQSLENNSDMEHRRVHHHYHRYGDEGYAEDECNNCACNKCENPPECCRKVCESCPKRVQMPQIQYMSIPEMPPISIPSMSIPPSSAMSMSVPLQPNPVQMAIPQISQIPMGIPQMPIQIPAMPMQIPAGSFPYQGSYTNQKLVLFSLPSNFMSLINNMTTAEQLKNKQETNVTTIQTSTITQITTTTNTESTLTTSKTVLQDRQDLRAITEKFDENMLQLIIKSALDNYSNSINKDKSSDKSIGESNKLMSSPFRRTKPVSKFGIVPISNNMALSLMSQLRGGRNGRRTKIMTMNDSY